MVDNHIYFLSLHSYLNRADQHYVEGRLLWKTSAIDGACNLLWLSIEQMIKLLIIQRRIEERRLESVEVRENGHRVILNYDPQENDIRKIHKILDRTSYAINSKHQLDELLEILNDETGITLNEYRDTLEKVKEYYERRYYKDEGNSIALNQLETIDKIYFYLRDHVSSDITKALIDEIAFQLKFNIGHPLPHYQVAYEDNNFFKGKRHPATYFKLPNGKIVKNDGNLDEIVPAAPAGLPLHGFLNPHCP